MLDAQVGQTLSRVHRAVLRDRIGRTGRDTGRTTPTTILVAHLEFRWPYVSQQHGQCAERPVRLRNHLARTSSPAQPGTNRKRTLEDWTVIDVSFRPHAQTCGVSLELRQMRLQLRMVVGTPGVTGDPSDPGSIAWGFRFWVRVRNHQGQNAPGGGETRTQIISSSHACWQVIHARVKSGLEPIFETLHVSRFNLCTRPTPRIESDFERVILEFSALLIGIHSSIVPRCGQRMRNDSLRCARDARKNHQYARAGIQGQA